MLDISSPTFLPRAMQNPGQHLQDPRYFVQENPSSSHTEMLYSTQPNIGVKRTSHEAGLLHDHLGIGLTEHSESKPQVPNKKTPPPNGKKTKGRVKIKMEFIDNKLRRYTTFSKRKTGIMKKAYELSTLTGTQVMLLVASETGHVYTFATRKLQPMITSEAGKALIQTCLNSPDPPSSTSGLSHDQRMSATGFEETEFTYTVSEEEQKEEMSPKSEDDLNDCDMGGGMCPSSPNSSSSHDPSPSPTLAPLINASTPPTAHKQTSGIQAVSAQTGFATILSSAGVTSSPTEVTMSTSSTGTLMYQTPQGVVYASPTAEGGLIFNLSQALTQDQGTTTSQHYITIPVPTTLPNHSSSNMKRVVVATDLTKSHRK